MFDFQVTLGTKILKLEVSLNTEFFPFLGLPVHGVTYPQRCFRRSMC
jgi:hypothetical protein